MVVHRADFTSDYPEWSALLGACEDYAMLCGWRFVLADFMDLENQGQSAELRSAREKALPMALAYADRVRAAAAHSTAPTRLVSEFQHCQRMVASEAVYNSMVATVMASFTLEAFGTKALTGLDAERFNARLDDYRAMLGVLR